MSSYALLVYSRPKPGQDAAYNHWYTHEHVPDVICVPGFVAAQRFEMQPPVGSEPAGSEERQYLAIYEIEGVSPEVALAALADAVKAGKVSLSDTLDLSSVSRVVVRSVTERISSAR